MPTDLFEFLNDENNFCRFVTDQFEAAPRAIAAVMACKHTVDPARVQYAFRAYQQALAKFSIFLHSQNPDHYKRAGALLFALNASAIVTSLDLESSSEELKSGFTRVTLGDAEHILKFVEFYEPYHNNSLAFEFAYRCCAAYEDNPRGFDFDYLHNVCRYLKSEKALSLDSCFMLFKSLMQ